MELLQTWTHVYYAPVHSAEDEKREKKIPRIKGKYNQVYQNYLDVSSTPTNYLEGMPEEKPLLSFHHKCKRLEFAKCYWNFDHNHGQMKRKFGFFANEHSRWLWRKKKNNYTKYNLYVSMVEEMSWCGFFLQRPWESY